MAKVYQDSIAVWISNTAGFMQKSVPDAPELRWSLTVYPKSHNATSNIPEAHIDILDGNVIVEAVMSSSRFAKTVIFDTEKVRKFVSSLFDPGDRRFMLLCTVTFYTKETKIIPPAIYEILEEGHPQDAKIMVGRREIKIHRDFLSMISPVFKAMFASNMKEARTGIVNITDFDFETVKTVLDFSYARPLEYSSLSNVFDMIRFCDKYDIQAVIKKFENTLADNISVFYFAKIASCAWQYSLKTLQMVCGRFFYVHTIDICCNRDFVNLEPNVIAEVIKACKEFANSEMHRF